ncbi:hypothetical protein [Nocardia sp. CA-120079]|uniref:hypothetical protein n=1 Tax=Nocardia sp. CA-120079 TaxID=3239974 RepID=UPI003D983E54
MSSLSELRKRHPDNFGWRLWNVWGDGRLYSAYQCDAFADEPTFTAGCSHGNDVPSDACACGVHYVTNTENFFTTVEYLNNPATAWDWPLWSQVYTFGAAIGGTTLDFNEGEFWLERPRRCATYRILGIVLPGLSSNSRFKVLSALVLSSPRQQELAARYDLPEVHRHKAHLAERYGVPIMTGQYSIGDYGNLVHAGRALEQKLDKCDTLAEVASLG